MIRFNDLTIEEARILKRTIVNYLNFSPALYVDNRVMTVEEINALNRDEMARIFFDSQSGLEKYKDLIDQELINPDELMDDIACYIDLKIPKAWHFKTLKRKSIASKKDYRKMANENPYIDISIVPGAKFKYSENYIAEKNILRASEQRAAQLTSVSVSS